MDFLKNNQRLTFKYGGVDFSKLKRTVSTKEQSGEYVTEYILPDGLKITNIAKKYDKYGAYEWVTYFENTGEKDTDVISELFDCDADFAFEYDKRVASLAFVPKPNTTKIFNPNGSTCNPDDFCADADEVFHAVDKINYIFPGDEKIYAADGGRSSQKHAPFFDINRMDKGVIFAIGWTGQWNCRLKRNDTHINIRTGIEGVHFKLYPNEKVRTSSIVILPYETGQMNAHNQWRRLLKEHFSLIGQAGRPQQVPFSSMLWGGLSSDEMVERINKIGNNKLGFDFIWVDAGWYGKSKLSCPNEFEGDWYEYTGDWSINTNYHPDALQDVAKAVKNHNMKFLLWFEPERVRASTPIAKEHPEYFFRINTDNDWGDGNCILNLGDDDAWNYCYDTLCEKIETLGIDCYRQDSNFEPLKYWRENEKTDRRGINEIKHIVGMYRLWDALLERFPNIIIDNCASGGRRIDVETLRRSVPLWRSDYQCSANFDVDITQTHTMGFSWWIPYSATGAGRVIGDTYRMRSTYNPGMSSSYWYSEVDAFHQTKEEIAWIKKTNMEFLRVRPYYSCDFYPLTEPALDHSNWCAYQFDRPEENDGIVMVFKREKSPFISANFHLGALQKDKMYQFIDADTEESFEVSARELKDNGFTQTIREQCAAKLYYYKVIANRE